MVNQKLLAGTELKMLIGFCYTNDDSITLDSIRWFTEWYTGEYNSKSAIRVEKDQCVRKETANSEGTTTNWYAYVDTTGLKPGVINMRFTAFIPDADAKNGTRKEYSLLTTNISIF